MTAFVDNFSLDVSGKKFDGYYAQYTCKVTLVERFGNGSVRELNERSINERSFTSEPTIEKYQAKPAHVNTTVYLDVIEKAVEHQKLL